MRKSVYTEGYAVLIALLRAARDDAGLTQADVAKRLKKPQSFVAKYEGGERRLDVVEFVIIAKALGADASKLFARLLSKLS